MAIHYLWPSEQVSVAVRLWTCIQGVLSSNLSRGTSSPDWQVFRGFSQSPPPNSGITPLLTNDCFLPNRYQFMIHQSFHHSHRQRRKICLWKAPFYCAHVMWSWRLRVLSSESCDGFRLFLADNMCIVTDKPNLCSYMSNITTTWGPNRTYRFSQRRLIVQRIHTLHKI
jgi:hypothetical protein